MDALNEQFGPQLPFLIAMAVLLIPILFITRRYSIPAIQYTLECLIYMGLFHAALWVIVGGTRWFKENSSMKALREDGKPADAPEWGIPLFEFWEREAYNPTWLVWINVVAAVCIVMLVARYRPMKIQKNTERRYDDAGGKIKRPGDAVKRGRYAAARNAGRSKRR